METCAGGSGTSCPDSESLLPSPMTSGATRGPPRPTQRPSWPRSSGGRFGNTSCFPGAGPPLATPSARLAPGLHPALVPGAKNCSRLLSLCTIPSLPPVPSPVTPPPLPFQGQRIKGGPGRQSRSPAAICPPANAMAWPVAWTGEWAPWELEERRVGRNLRVRLVSPDASCVQAPDSGSCGPPGLSQPKTVREEETGFT